MYEFSHCENPLLNLTQQPFLTTRNERPTETDQFSSVILEDEDPPLHLSYAYPGVAPRNAPVKHAVDFLLNPAEILPTWDRLGSELSRQMLEEGVGYTASPVIPTSSDNPQNDGNGTAEACVDVNVLPTQNQGSHVEISTSKKRDRHEKENLGGKSRGDKKSDNGKGSDADAEEEEGDLSERSAIGEEVDEFGGKHCRKKQRTTHGVVGNSRSMRNERQIKRSVKDGSYTIQPQHEAKFQATIRKLDPHAERDLNDVCRLRHSTCGEYIRLRTPCHVERFKKHVESCPALMKTKRGKPGLGAGMRTLDAMRETWEAKAKEKTSPPMQQRPCPGLSEREDERITRYLTRSKASGGGSVTLAAATSALFNHEDYGGLSQSDKTEVLAAQLQMNKWRNVHNLQRIYSTACSKTGRTRLGSPDSLPCHECSELLKLPAFLRILRVEIPEVKNMKFTPKRWREAGSDDLLGKYEGEGLRKIIATYQAVSLSCPIFHMP